MAVLARPEAVRDLVHSALQPQRQVVERRPQVAVPFIVGPSRLDDAGRIVGFGDEFAQDPAVHVGIRARIQTCRHQFAALHGRSAGFRRLAECEQNLYCPQNFK